jgi:hypothetical protein
MKRAEVEALAESMGLKIAANNPGDGVRYAVNRNGEYFSSSNNLFVGTLREAYAYLRGYQQWDCYIRQEGNAISMKHVREEGTYAEVRYVDEIWEVWLVTPQESRLVQQVSDVVLAVINAYTITHYR